MYVAYPVCAKCPIILLTLPEKASSYKAIVKTIPVKKQPIRLAWLTDLHLEFVPAAEKRAAFYVQLAAAQPDLVLVGGDTGTADSFDQYLQELAAHLQRPIYFVLGNHDFYGGSLAHTRRTAAALAQASPWLHWLPQAGAVKIAPHTSLLGHGAWADGRLGQGADSQIMLNDYFQIQELRGLTRQERFARLNALGDEAAAHFARVLPNALRKTRRLLLLTHVPPFHEACWHEGQLSGPDYLPHFSCQAVGAVLKRTMQAHPHHQLTVLCGHTHGRGEAQLLPNLIVKTGGATYGHPEIQELLLAG